jgi:hypothetical protein
MDDSLFDALKKEPEGKWVESLRLRLRQDEIANDLSPRPRYWRWVAVAASFLLVAGLLQVPAVRASAESFLSLFRVVNFVAVKVDPDRFRALNDSHLDLERLIGEHVQILEDPGPPQSVASLEDAAAIAGSDLKMPSWLPPDTRIIEVTVAGERAARVTADSNRLNEIMDALGITDLRAPAGLDGQSVTIRVPPVVMVRFETGGSAVRRTRLMQARAPEIAMPPGIDLSALSEIGLRMLGVSRDAARQFARTIDWNSTLIVPLPPTIQSFREVEIGGRPGIAISYQPPNESPTTMLLWTRDGRVFAMQSIQEMEIAIAMADSVQ